MVLDPTIVEQHRAPGAARAGTWKWEDVSGGIALAMDGRVPTPAAGPGKMPDVRTFPATDGDFAADVVRVGMAVAWNPRRLEERLRGRYPRVRVVGQEHLAMMEGNDPLIYAYRDGSILASPRSER
jgi:hypothetical protein